MSEELGPLWGVDPVGYRHGNLEGAHAVATSATAVVGGPVLIVGALGVVLGGLSVMQVLLVAPIAGIVGGAMVGASARMAAATGAPPIALLRPSFGRVGAPLASLLRICSVLAWVAVTLTVAGRWTSESFARLDLNVAVLAAVVGIAVLGILLTLGGKWSMNVVIRRPLYIASIALALLTVFVLLRSAGGLGGGGDASIWPTLQLAVEVCLVFVPFAQVVARHMADDREAMTAFGVGFAIPASVGFIVGGLLGGASGQFPFEMAALGPATTGALFGLVWVLVGEIDQVYAAFTAAGADATGIVPRVPVLVLAAALVAAAVGLTFIELADSIGIAEFLAALTVPIVAISLADFHVVRKRHYPESDLYPEPAVRSGGGGLLALACWLVAVGIGQMLSPSRLVMDVVGYDRMVVEGPWRLVAALAGAALYIAVLRIRHRRAASTESALRGMVDITQSKDFMS